MFDISACEIDNLTLTSRYLLHPHVFGDCCYSKYPWKALFYKSTYETEYMICFVPKSFVPISMKRMKHCRTRWFEVVNGQKNNDQRGVIQCYLMTCCRQISKVSPGFCCFLDLQASSGVCEIKFPGFPHFPGCVGTLDRTTGHHNITVTLLKVVLNIIITLTIKVH